MRIVLSLIFALLAHALIARPAMAETGRGAEADEAAIHALIDQWYSEHRKGEDGQPNQFHAPGAIDASPGFSHLDTGARAFGPRVYHSLASRALEFRYEITSLVADARFARLHVRERGYFYAALPQRTYERMGSALFVLEKQDDGRWLVLAHRSNSVSFPPRRCWRFVGRRSGLRDPQEWTHRAGDQQWRDHWDARLSSASAPIEEERSGVDWGDT
jgi:hypothetical protein